MSAAEFCCPICAAELTVEQLFAHEETRQAFARLAAVSLPLGSKLLAYVGLFAPARNRMSIARKVKLLLELLPMIESGSVERRGRPWAASRDAWHAAIDLVLAQRDARKLTLPLTSHGYLLEVLAGLADKAEAQQEGQVEHDRRHRADVSHIHRTADTALTVADAVGAALPSLYPQPDTEAAARGREIRQRLLAERDAKRAVQSTQSDEESTP